ncbi:MAG TPA: beta-propeller fold lactonase family protein [Candidatus Limnocylindrales bacterium]|nr:beta-propeller fold lactonase family protein [Candidatus Limnocylindrales bacterium]
MTRRSLASVAAALLILASCSTPPTVPSPAPTATITPSVLTPSTPTPTASPVPSDVPASPVASGPPVGGVYSATVGGQIQAAWAAMPARVYVPDEKSGNVVVIDPATFKIIGTIGVGKYPEHITPAWDGQLLYVNDMVGQALTEIDPNTAQPNGVTLKVPSPYNLYFEMDGSRAIIVEDMLKGAPTDPNGLAFFDLNWKKVGFLGIPWAGANHLDFSADGSTLLLSCEYSGRIVAVDVAAMKIITSLYVAGSPTDVRLSPDGSMFFVANQIRDGIDVIDATTLKYLSFIRAGNGAHGLAISRDATKLFVTNRLAASMSVIDIASLTVVATWSIGGSPDMIAQSPDGSQLWISNRYSGTISVVNAATGEVITTIATGVNPHGLAYWPQPGRFSLGHNGNTR